MMYFYDKFSYPKDLRSYDKYGEQIKNLKCSHSWTKNTDLNNVIHLLVKNPNLIVDYADLVLEGRWYEYEHVIVGDPYHAMQYAYSVIKGRWEEAEKKLMNLSSMHQHMAIINYAEYIIKGRWLEVEHLFKDSPWSASRYAIRVMNARWLEMEDVIRASGTTWYNYRSHFRLHPLVE